MAETFFDVAGIRSIASFGGDVTGVQDAVPALKAADAAAAASTGGVIWIPPGTWRLGSSFSPSSGNALWIAAGVTLTGSGSLSAGAGVLVDFRTGVVVTGPLVYSLATVVFAQSPYTIGATTGFIAFNATAGAISATLPAATGSGRQLIVMKTDSSANAVTVSRAGADTIQGATSVSLPTQYFGWVLTDEAAGLWSLSPYGANAMDLASAQTVTGVKTLQGPILQGPKLGVTAIAFAQSPYTVLATDALIQCDATNGAITINLPAATATGRSIIVTKTDASANVVTINHNGSDTINASTTYLLGVQYAAVQLLDQLAALWEGAPIGPQGPQLIASQILAAPATSISLQNITQALIFTGLRLVVQARTDGAVTADTLNVRLNNDTTSTPHVQFLNSTGSTVTGNTRASLAGAMQTGPITGASDATGTDFGEVVIDIPFYRDTTANKTVLYQAVAPYGSGAIQHETGAGYWPATTAISRIDLLPNTGTHFATGSRVNLYGIP